MDSCQRREPPEAVAEGQRLQGVLPFRHNGRPGSVPKLPNGPLMAARRDTVDDL